MGISVIEEKTTHNGTKGVICFESDVEGPNFSGAISELTGGDTKHKAIEEASKRGLSKPGIEGINNAAYPVDMEGNTVVNPVEQKTHRYRIEIPVTRQLV